MKEDNENCILSKAAHNVLKENCFENIVSLLYSYKE
jgi:hypothetical protein